MAEKCSVHDGEFKLILPLFDNSGRKIKGNQYNNYLKKMNKRFGGTTSNIVQGCYVDTKKEIQCEHNVVITGIRDMENPYQHNKDLSCEGRKKLLEKDCHFVNELSQIARKDFGQESIINSCNSIVDATFVKGRKKKKIADERTLSSMDLLPTGF